MYIKSPKIDFRTEKYNTPKKKKSLLWVDEIGSRVGRQLRVSDI